MHNSLKILIDDPANLESQEKKIISKPPLKGKDLVFLAIIKNIPVGYLVYNITNKKIKSIFIKPSFRHMHIAKKLLHTLLFMYPLAKPLDHPFFYVMGYKRINKSYKIDFTIFDLKINPYIVKYKNYFYNLYNGSILELVNEDLSKKKPNLFNFCFYVPLQTDFEAVFRYQLKQKKSQGSNLITIITTELCNLNCPYCFENTKDRTIITDKGKFLAVWKKIKPKIKNNFRLNFFGGEPFLNDSAIFWFTKKLRQYCEKRKYNYSLGVITNGTIFKKKYSNFFKRNEFEHIQITLDGDKTKHNKTRGQFNKIIENSHKFLSKAKTFGIRINVTKYNVESVMPLLKSLSREYNAKEKKKIFISVGFVYNENTKNFAPRKQYTSLISNIIELNCFGFKFLKDPKFRVPICPASLHDNAWIDLNCRAYFCEHQIGNPFWKFENFKLFLPPKCVSCTYFPVCGGQCWASEKTKEPLWRNCILIKAGVKDYVKKVYNQNKNKKKGVFKTW